MSWKSPVSLQLPLILSFGVLISIPFQNCAPIGIVNDAGASSAIPSGVPMPEPRPEQGPIKAKRQIASFSRDGSCRVTVTSCPRYPEIEGVKYDSYRSAHQIPLRCLERARHYSKVCESTTPVRAEFSRNGKVLNRAQF